MNTNPCDDDEEAFPDMYRPIPLAVSILPVNPMLHCSLSPEPDLGMLIKNVLESIREEGHPEIKTDQISCELLPLLGDESDCMRVVVPGHLATEIVDRLFASGLKVDRLDQTVVALDESYASLDGEDSSSELESYETEKPAGHCQQPDQEAENPPETP